MFLIFLLLSTLIPQRELVGGYGAFIGKSNFLLFGYISYLIPFYFGFILYGFYKDLKKEFFEKIFAVLIFIIGLIIIQSMLLKVGLIGNLFIDATKPFIGSLGIYLLVIAVFIISGLIFDIDFNKLKSNVKLPKLNVIENNKSSKKIIKESSNKEIEKPKEVEKEIKNVDEYIKEKLNETHKIEDENENLEEPNIKQESEQDIKPTNEVAINEKNIKNEESIEEDENENKEIEEKKVEETETIKEEILHKNIEPNKKEHNKSTLVKELDENKKLLNQLELTNKENKPKDFELPSLDFLATPPKIETKINEEEIDKKVALLLNKLRNFKVEGDVVRTYTGPVVTTFEFKPLPHIKVSKILNLADDLAMALKAETIRIQAPIPGKDVVGIEIPNNEFQTIYLREILEDEIFKKAKSPLAIALGKDIVGRPFVTDLAKLPHLLIAGTTGSGKSVGINAMILSLLYRNSPDDLKLMMIDPKQLEFSIYDDIPHLLTPVITDPKKAMVGLNNVVKEMERRYTLMKQAKVKNIENYNNKFPEEKLPYIVVVIDELADLMMTGGKDVEYSIARLAQMARASGIHLIVATQRPSVDVVTGNIKANLPSRISYKVGQKIDSKVILDVLGAESLLGKGDMLFKTGSNLIRLHAPFTTEEEIEMIVEFLKAQREVEYNEEFLSESISSDDIEIENKDELFDEAKEIMLREGKTSISYIQRRLQIGYNRAANIVEQLEASGFLSTPNSKGQREILE